jgi:hypothetical protein
MKRTIIAALAGLAVFTLATPAMAANATSAGHPHPGWQHNPRNPHYVKLVRPPAPNPGCTWVIGGAVGDVPRCV